jgi:ribosomal protein L16 Arg81 hydroxylase
VSAVDVEAPDAAEHFPAFANAKPFDTVLGPGDVLFIPRGWWHYVRSLTPSFSVNFWF